MIKREHFLLKFLIKPNNIVLEIFWFVRFIGQPGTDADIKKAFDGVDIDRSGLLTWTEFVFSIMGEKASKFGVLADMESLQDLLKETVTELTLLKEALNDSRGGAERRQAEAARLRARLENAGNFFMHLYLKRTFDKIFLLFW